MSLPGKYLSSHTMLENATNQTINVREQPLTALNMFLFRVTFSPFRVWCYMKTELQLLPSSVQSFLFTTQVLNVRPRRYNNSCRKPFQRSGKLAPWVLKLLRISWSSISDSVSVPWNNTRLAVTESCLLLCQYRLQVSIHLPALINYTSQWQITPHSFVCSHMHGNKRIRYQGKLIYSDEDGVPTALSEMNACTQCHRPAWQLSQRGILSVTLLYVCLLVAAHILPCGSHPDVIYHQVLIINPT